MSRATDAIRSDGVGAQVTWRNTGPGLGGKKLFIGFQRRF
jgi:hypothetical protein